MLYDTHAHLDFDGGERLTSALDAARHFGIAGWMVPGVSLTTNLPQSLLARPDVSHAVGIHPEYLPSDLGDRSLDETLMRVEARAVETRARAIGECGLDARDAVPLSVQQRWFEAHLALARSLELPVVLHQVGARREFLETLERMGPLTRGILHGFSGDVGWAKALVRRGLVLGIGPALLVEQRARLVEVAREIPLSALVLETDLPKSKGREFTPLVLAEVAARLAEVRRAPVGDVAEATTETALGLFGLKAV